MPKQPVSASCCWTDLWSWTNREKSLRAPASGHEEIRASHRVKFWRKAVKLQALLPSLWLQSLWQLHYLWKMTELCCALLENSVWCAGMKWCMSVFMYLCECGPATWLGCGSEEADFFFFFWSSIHPNIFILIGSIINHGNSGYTFINKYIEVYMYNVYS